MSDTISLVPRKIDVGSVNVTVRPADFDTNEDRGRIPDNLAALTYTVLMLHRANGDLAWVSDMLAEAESQ